MVDEKVKTEDVREPIPVPKTPQQLQKEQFDREERLRGKQQQFDPRIHGVGTVYSVEPQSVKEVFQYLKSLEARVKQLENLTIGEPAVPVVDPNVPQHLGVFPVHAPTPPDVLRNEFAQKAADIKSVPPAVKPAPQPAVVEQPAQKEVPSASKK
jgi:hypothetical protein